MDKTKRVVIDTNLLIRYLVNDDARKAQVVDALLKKAGKGEVHILMPAVVVAELVWVLESFYRMEAGEIADDVIVRSALKRYKTERVDLVDAWIAAFAQEKGAQEIHTFDKKHFKGIEGVTVVQL